MISCIKINILQYVRRKIPMILVLKPNDACTSVIWVIIASDKGLWQSRLLHPYWLIVYWTIGYKFHWTSTQNAIMSIQMKWICRLPVIWYNFAQVQQVQWKGANASHKSFRSYHSSIIRYASHGMDIGEFPLWLIPKTYCLGAAITWHRLH